jgi:hypothetical protein
MRELCAEISTYSDDDDDDDSRPETYDELDTDDNSNINDIDTSLYNTHLANTLPSYFTVVKLGSNTTSFNQGHDLSKYHPDLRKRNGDLSLCLMEGQDEAKLPSYMELVDNLLKHYKFSKPNQRSYFRLLANLERNIEIAGNTAVMTKGHELAGSSSFDFKTFIHHWPGHRSLTNSDHDYIINIFPTLAQEAFCKGVLHTSDWIPIIGEFVFEKNIEGCNEIALSLIAQEQQKEEKVKLGYNYINQSWSFRRTKTRKTK